MQHALDVMLRNVYDHIVCYFCYETSMAELQVFMMKQWRSYPSVQSLLNVDRDIQSKQH